MLHAPQTSLGRREITAVQVLRPVWIQQFYAPSEKVQWREAKDLPPGVRLISTPYDAEARYCPKRTTEWTGYKVHLTETCDEDAPHLITDVETTPATTSDAERQLLPTEHLVDAGDVTADHLVSSQTDHGVCLLGPVAEDSSWQARTHAGYAVATFRIDWDAQPATCPQGHVSTQWITGQDRHPHERITIRFARSECLACPVRRQCTHSATQPHQLAVRVRAQHEALQAARLRQTTESFAKEYALRAGIEGTLSQAVRLGDLHRSRYSGLAKTHLQHGLTATAVNVSRVGARLADLPLA